MKLRSIFLLLIMFAISTPIAIGVHHENKKIKDDYYMGNISWNEKRSKELWIDLNEHNSHIIGTNSIWQNLSFEFSFFGHPINSVWISNRGYISTVDQDDQMEDLDTTELTDNTNLYIKLYKELDSMEFTNNTKIHAENRLPQQCIAALYAAFTTKPDGLIRVLSNNTQFTVSFERMRLPHRYELASTDANVYFTYQTTLYKTGNIVFVYKTMPDMSKDFIIGLSDAYKEDDQYYTYDRDVSYSHYNMTSWSSIYLTALPVCVNQKTCSSCLTHSTSHLKCLWCPRANLCSSGRDWNYPAWLDKDCTKGAVTEDCKAGEYLTLVYIGISVFMIVCIAVVLLLFLRKRHLQKMLEEERQNVAELQRLTKMVVIEPPTPSKENGHLQLPVVTIQTVASTSDKTTSNDYEFPRDDKWEFPRQCLILGTTLGEGNFGKVVKAEAKNILKADTVTTVAVKMLKQGHTDADLIDLVSEMTLMKMIGKHIYIISLLGVCTQDGPLHVIVEYAPHNNLRHFLIVHNPLLSLGHLKESATRQMDLTDKDFLLYAYQVASGMQYLHSQKFIHRDLAARNVLVGENFIMKIADFGLARDVHVNEIYNSGSHKKLPIKWLAPEALAHNRYSYKSDVWSFGILLWEIFTMGSMPYPTLSNLETEQSVKTGYRMEKPDKCSEEVYKVMCQCWRLDASERPEFSELMFKLDQMLISPAGGSIGSSVSSRTVPLTPVADRENSRYVRLVNQNILDKVDDVDASWNKLNRL